MSAGKETPEQKAIRLLNAAFRIKEPFNFDKPPSNMYAVSLFNIEKLIELAIAEEREANGWVSVKDRLPYCQFENEELEMMSSQSVKIHGLTKDGQEAFGIGEFLSNGTWHCYGGEHDFMHVEIVTHWSELRADPKDEVIKDA